MKQRFIVGDRVTIKDSSVYGVVTWVAAKDPTVIAIWWDHGTRPQRGYAPNYVLARRNEP